MKTKLIIGLGALALTACGGTKTVYVERTDAPDTTTKVVRTTDAPIATPAPSFSDEELYVLGVHATAGQAVYVDDEMLIETGYGICSALDAGASMDEVAIIAVTQAGGDDRILSLFASVTASAVYNLCPEYLWMMQ